MLLRFAGRDSPLVLGICALLLWAPLPAGSVTPAGQLVTRLAACGLVALALAARPDASRRSLLPVAALAAVAVLGLVQSCPWPAGAVAVVSPEHARLAADTATLTAAAPPPAFVALSLDAAAARSAALSWLAAALLLAVALVGGRRAIHRRWMLAALVTSALAQLALGLLRLESSSVGGLAAVVLRPEGRLRGTFANPNHLSLLFELALVATAAWVWAELSRLWRGAGGSRFRALGAAAVWAALLAAVVLTGSRAGLAAALVGTAAQAVAVPLAGGRRRAAAAVAIALLLGLGALFVAGSGAGIGRYQEVSVFESNLRGRLLLTVPALDLWRRFPVTGTGLGTFEDAFPLAAPAELATMRWNRAHNDPLELMVTGGVVGLALGLAALVALMPPIWRGLRHGDGVEGRAAGLAAVGALSAAGLHELFDFGLVIPANALALLVILGSAAAAGWTVQDRPNRQPRPARE